MFKHNRDLFRKLFLLLLRLFYCLPISSITNGSFRLRTIEAQSPQFSFASGANTPFLITGVDEDYKEVRNDKQVWNKIYKNHFDDNGISSHLAAHKVKTKNDELEFDKAWKNGVWNCFEPVSFNLTKPDTIKDKVYKWVGKLDELSSTKESLHIYLLSVLPLDHPELNAFIQHKIKRMSSDKLKVELVLENNIGKVVKKIKKEIDQQN